MPKVNNPKVCSSCGGRGKILDHFQLWLTPEEAQTIMDALARAKGRARVADSLVEKLMERGYEFVEGNTEGEITLSGKIKFNPEG